MIPLTLNWFGMAVHDVIAATDFYGRKLGFSYWQNEGNSPWRQFNTRRMIFELFEAHPDRLKVTGWGNGQAFRPVILVQELAATEAMLQDQGVPLSRETSEFGARIEMAGPEGIRWGLIEAPDAETDWAHPVIGGIELKASDLEAQKTFYTEILGMTIEHETDRAVHLGPKNEETWLRIEAGGITTPLSAGMGNPKPAFFRPIWISYETKDVRRVNDWLHQQNVTIIHPLTHHEDWNGTDIILADVDGNAIQVVQYGKSDGN